VVEAHVIAILVFVIKSATVNDLVVGSSFGLKSRTNVMGPSFE